VIWELSLVVGAYLLGSVPSALFVVWLMTGKDVRDLGSGNIGATNATRVGGLRAGVVVTILDVAKGALPVWAMSVFHPASGWLAATMLAAVVGHCYPVWLKFRGGKGVATAFGAFLVLSPWSAAAGIVLWLIVLLIWRRVSLASMVASAAFPPLLVMIDDPTPVILAAVSAASVLIVLRHHDNIRHLLAGDEPKIGSSGGGEG
jgi:glycerol-3-phosphate acyltransferase PlsY